ncbi:hypothetical protein KVT40_001371 [Elsinoe batatas]|uniref:Rhodopsin domain-containing protein n=1 Tax=Elsinoe batatas TaxID=2601811 RepID=A0A8K0L5U6_9PEZI|nr:hypothetical protein KVT40_001371 [Elsinoe batatas]
MAPSTAIGCQIACILLVLLAWLSILLRFYTRLFVVRALSADDWSILLTTIIFTFFSALVFSTVHVSTTLPLTLLLNLSRAATLLFASFNLYIITTISLKISLTLFFLRLLPRATHRPQRLVLYATTAAFLLLGAIYFFLTLFDCGDPRHYLENQLAEKCLDKHRVTIPVAYAYSSLNALTDWVFVAIPLSVVVKSQLSPRSRAVVTALLRLGAIGSICSLVRIGFIHLLNAEFTDLFKTAYNIGTLSVIEIGLGIVASSLATLRPLVSSWKIEGFETRRSKGSKGRTPVATPGQTVGTVVGETEKGLTQEEKEAEGRIEARRGGRDMYASEDLEVEEEEQEEEEEGEVEEQVREDTMRKKSIAVVNEVIVETEEATPEELEEMRGPRRTKRWSVAPRISMSWMRSSWAVDRKSKVVG